MYGIALSVLACLRGGTRVDVAWSLDPELTPGFDPEDAVAITPGGGRLGSLFGGAIDSRLAELALGSPSEARVVTIEVDPIEAESLALSPGTALRIVFAPAGVLPEGLWQPLIDREPITIEADRDRDRLPSIKITTPEPATSFTFDGDRLRCSWSPTPSLVLYGGGPMAEAVAHVAGYVGWKVDRPGGPDHAIGIAATLSPLDSLVVMGHDTEAVGRVLHAALGSSVGYIGSIGPENLQQDRGDWLAYRGVTDLTRIHAPAGFPIGARTPEEVAVSVVCEMVAARNPD